MVSGAGDGGKDSLTAALETAGHHVSQGAYLDALATIEPLLAQGPRTQPLYDCAAKAATSAILDGSLDGWMPERRGALLETLVLQPERFGAPPAFHHEIASRHSAGQAQALAKVAAELKPLLSRLWDAGGRERNLLLMILLLRSALAGWRDEAEISRLHIEALRDFERADMAIPYNMIFDSLSFARNVEDLRGLIDKASIEELARYGAWKPFYMQIITGSARLDRDLPKIVAALRADGADTGSDEAAGLRSLALRAAAAGRTLLPADGPDTDFESFAAEWATLCTPARTATEPGRKPLARLQSRKRQAVHAALDLAGRRAPFLRLPGRRTPRIAVCVSGQLRGYRKAYGTWREGLLRHAETQIFVHSWNRIGRSGAEPFRSFLPFEGERFCAAYREQAHGVAMDALLARYPRLFAALRETGEVTAAEIGAFYGTDHVVLEDDAGPAFEGWSNSAKMHYKLAAAASLAEASGMDADLVLRIRPDKQLGLVGFAWADLLDATTGYPLILADFAMGQQYGSPMIGDQVAIGAPAAMAVYAATHRMALRLAEHGAFACEPEYKGHVSLALTCWHGAITVQRLPVRMGALMEAEPLAARTIAQCLETDAAGRLDHMDQALLGAIRADLGTKAG